MPQPNYKTCRQCGRHTRDCGPISWTRLCADCGKQNFVDNLDHLTAHDGPYFTHWRRRIAASVGAGLLDDTTSNP